MEKVNILLVDDQPGKLLSYQTILGDLGENLVLAGSGREALQFLLKNEVALILLDVVMPDMDGFETATLIRQHPRLEQTPIIFVTALSTTDVDRLKGYTMGAVDYVFVPVVPEVLRAKSLVFVELYRKRKELQNEIVVRKQAEEALLKQTLILQSILDSMADAVIVVDAEGKLVLSNPAAAHICSSGPADMIPANKSERSGLFLSDMVTPYPADKLPLTRVLRNEGVDAIEMFVRHPKAPRGIWLSANARPLHGKNGVTHGGVTVIRDITASKVAERELRSSREQLRNLSAYLQSVREDERTHIAREIHDDLGQGLTVLKMDLAWLDRGLNGEHRPLRAKILGMSKYIDLMIQTVRKIASELRPVILDDLGLSAAIEWEVKQFEERTGIDCELIQLPENIILDRERSTAVFRVMQEALTNITRHAKATKVKIHLRQTAKKVILKVRDNGVGITNDQVSDPRSFGLIGMRERVHSWQGRVRFKSSPNRGTIVHVSMLANG